jgi:glycerophosphoryl diester phosphodiesterase
MTKPILIAHRGVSSEAPENTLAAFQRALDLSIPFLEMDIRLTKDDVPVIIHDATAFRTTFEKCTKKIKEMTLKEIQSLDAGLWFDEQFAGIGIPTLKQVLNLNLKQTGLMLELKKDDTPPQKLVKIVLEEIKQSNIEKDKVKLASFAPEIVQEFNKQDDSYSTLGIVEASSMIAPFLEMKIKHLAVWYKLINPTLMSTLKDENIVVWDFTVDRPKVASFLTSLNIDGIITNNPRLIQESLIE